MGNPFAAPQQQGRSPAPALSNRAREISTSSGQYSLFRLGTGEGARPEFNRAISTVKRIQEVPGTFPKCLYSEGGAGGHCARGTRKVSS
jgi:hypothetical protein